MSNEPQPPLHWPAPFTGLADIQALETRAHAQWLGAASTIELLERAASASPDAPAIQYVHDADDPASLMCWRHRELLDSVRRAAGLFRALGVQRGEPVAILAPHLPATQVALWGAQLAGAALPLNYLLDAAHLAQLIRAAGARVVVALGPAPGLPIHETVVAAIERVNAAASGPDGGHRVSHLLSIDPNEPAPRPDSFQARVQAADALADAAPGPDDLAALYHTGGTTGLPKLLPHSHRNEVHTSRCAPAYYDFRAGDCMFNGFPLFHVAGAFVYGLSCLARGGSLLLPTLTGMRDPAFVARAWQWFGQVGVSHLGCVPTVLSALLAAPRAGGVPTTLRVAMSGGSPLPNELALRFEREIGVPVRNIFGMTESAGLVSIEPVGAPRSAGSVGLRLPYTEVIAVPRATVEALSPEANTFAAAAARAGTPSRCPELDERQADDPVRLAQATGVIAMRGPHVSRGYLDAARRLGTFTDDGWLLSGDLGHVMQDGRIVLSGRAKDVIIRSSHNIDPGLIEDAFMAHPSVAAAAAVGEPDAYAGELPVVFVLPKPGERIDADELARAIAPTIAEPPAVPKRVTVLEQMPMTAIGKIYKPALRVRAAQQKLDEIVARVAPDTGVGVDVTEAPGGVAVAVRFGAGVDAPVRARVRAALGELAVPVRFDEAG